MAEEEVNQSNIEELTPPKTNTTQQKPMPAKPIQQKPMPAKPMPAKPIQQTTKPAPKIIPAPQAPIESTKRLKPQYRYIGKESIGQMIRRSIPKQFIATERFGIILGLIFLAVIVLALVQFPFGKLLSGDTSIIIGIGYPKPFLELGIMDPEAPPLRPKNLLLDLILYLLVSYLIDIAINFILDTKLIKSEEELKKKPKVFKNTKPTLADKITKKIFD